MGERIKIARMARGLTQEQLAEKAGITRVSLARIENGYVLNISTFTAVNIAKALNLTLDFLLCGEC